MEKFGFSLQESYTLPMPQVIDLLADTGGKNRGVGGENGIIAVSGGFVLVIIIARTALKEAVRIVEQIIRKGIAHRLTNVRI